MQRYACLCVTPSSGSDASYPPIPAADHRQTHAVVRVGFTNGCWVLYCAVQLLLAAGAPVDGVADETPLFHAAERGWVSLLCILLRHGANVHTRNYKGNTPLWIASCFRNDACMVELLNAGADPNGAYMLGCWLGVAARLDHVCVGLLFIHMFAAANAKGEVPLINRCVSFCVLLCLCVPLCALCVPCVCLVCALCVPDLHHTLLNFPFCNATDCMRLDRAGTSFTDASEWLVVRRAYMAACRRGRRLGWGCCWLPGPRSRTSSRGLQGTRLVCVCGDDTKCCGAH